jgi:eukaryotic-like serine/threonine-protein kinase
LGRLSELDGRVRAQLREAEERGDLYHGTNLRGALVPVLDLKDDRPGDARAHAAAALDGWTQGGYTIQHYNHFVALGQTDLYEGDGAAAYARSMRSWPQIRGAFFLELYILRVEATWLRARSALAMAREARAPEPLLRQAEKDAARLAREGSGWATGLAGLVRAAIDARRGRVAESLARLDRAIAAFDGESMVHLGAAARRRRGELLGGDEGRAMVRAADEALAREGVRAPTRFAAHLAPGF